MGVQGHGEALWKVFLDVQADEAAVEAPHEVAGDAEGTPRGPREFVRVRAIVVAGEGASILDRPAAVRADDLVVSHSPGEEFQQGALVLLFIILGCHRFIVRREFRANHGPCGPWRRSAGSEGYGVEGSTKATARGLKVVVSDRQTRATGIGSPIPSPARFRTAGRPRFLARRW